MSDPILIKPGQPHISSLPGMITLPDGGKNIQLGSGVVTSVISSGGMAIIYEIWNPELEVTRAVKLLHPDHSADSEERFYTEMKITAKLHHPNIVEIYSVGKWNNLPYIEMERIDGCTLEKFIADRGALPLEVCTAIAIMVGRALNYAHNQHYVIFGTEYQGIIHRDLKPGNIMVTNDGIIKLMDFGIAKPLSATSHTLEGIVMGTMQYLAPEQLDGKQIDRTADIYALGTVLYETLTGKQAYPEVNIGKLVTDKLNNNYIPLDSYKTHIPAPLCGLIHKCMRYEKEKRVQTILEFLHILGDIHKTITHNSPESVMDAFMKRSVEKKTVVSLKTRVSRMSGRGVFLLVLGCLVLCGLLVYGSLSLFTPSLNVLKSTSSLPSRAQALLGSPQNTTNMQTPSLKANSLVEMQKTEPLEPLLNETINDPFDAPIIQQRKKTGIKEKNSKQNPTLSSSNLKSILNGSPAQKTLADNPLTQSSDIFTAAPQSATLGQPKNDLIDRLAYIYKTRSPLVLFFSEVEAEHFQNARALYPLLKSDDAVTKKAKIYYMRSLSSMSDKTRLQAFLDVQDIYDGEFYLEKARDCRLSKNIMLAQEMIRKASITPAAFLTPRVFRESLEFEKAHIATTFLEIAPTLSRKQSALDAWNNVKQLLKSNPDHPYYSAIESETKRITLLPAYY